MGFSQPGGASVVSVQNALHTFAADAEASDAYAITLDPAVTAYVTGQSFTFSANTANTGASSLNVNGLGARTLKKEHDVDTITGDIEAGSVIEVVNDGTNFQIVSTSAVAPGTLNNIVEDTTPQLGGTFDTNSFAINETKAGDVASATTTDIGAVAGNFVFITGTTTITGLGTVAAGTKRVVKFVGILILTQNATSLILPTAANITTAADDRAEFISLGSGNWICTKYTRASGQPLVTELSSDATPVLGGELDAGANSIGFTAQTATGDGTTTIDWGLGNKFNFQFGAFNETFTFTDPAKPGNFTLKLVQDSVGSRTATFPANVEFSGGTAPTLTTTATTGTDIISFYFDGTDYFGGSILDFS